MDVFNAFLIGCAIISGLRATVDIVGIILNTIQPKLLAVISILILIPALWFSVYNIAKLL